jgi:hypothetical protein
MKHPVLFALLLLLGIHSSITRAQAPPAVTSTLDLSSSDGHHVTLNTDAFRSMQHTTVRVHNPHTSADETYEGVELSLLLARVDAPLGTKLHGGALAMYIVAEGTDHYRAVYSLAEVDPAFHGGNVIVADRMDGHPLDAKNGPFKLVNTEDKRPARWVHCVASIQLKSAP